MVENDKAKLIDAENLPDALLEALSHDQIAQLGAWLYRQLGRQRDSDHEFYSKLAVKV